LSFCTSYFTEWTPLIAGGTGLKINPDSISTKMVLTVAISKELKRKGESIRPDLSFNRLILAINNL
jgi:hypothetical protein